MSQCLGWERRLGPGTWLPLDFIPHSFTLSFCCSTFCSCCDRSQPRGRLYATSYEFFWASQVGLEWGCQCRRCKGHGFDPWVRKIP